MTTHSTSPLGGYEEPTSTPATRAGAVRSIPVQFSARRLVRFLWVGTALVILLGIGSRLAGAVETDFPGRDLFAQMFALNSEANVPTLFSCLLLGTAAAVAWVIALGKRQQADRFQRLWLVMSAVFVYLAVDEVVQVHDRATLGVRNLLGDSAIFHYAWVVPYAFVVLAIVVLFVPFLRHLPRRTSGGMILAGALYVLGAMGLEVIEGMLEFSGQFYSLAMPVLVTIEESLEMSSIVLLIWVLLNYLRDQLPGLHLDLSLGDKERA